jgi:ABC-type uncharacterized transport system permease subunit
VSIVLILFLLPAALYAVVWRLSLHARSRALTAALLALALALHAASLILPWQPGSFYYGFAKLLSATVWIGVLLVWVESARVDLASLSSLLAPLAIVLVVLPYFFPGVAFDLQAQPPLFVPHLVVGTLAYGVMFLAAMQALLMAAAEHRLHPRRPSERPGLLASVLARRSGPLPPLMVLERILFRVIGIGFVLLLLTTVTGIVFSEEIFGKPLQLNHKTVFSLVATVFVGVLLAGHRLRGWRGRTAIRLTLGGFMLLLLSYVGSRFVLEVVLRRI